MRNTCKNHCLATCSHLVCILEDKLAFKGNPADTPTEWSRFHQHREGGKAWEANHRRAFSQTRFNELSSFFCDISSSTSTTNPPPAPGFSSSPRLRLHRSPLSIQNSIPGRGAINLLQRDGAAAECRGYSRLLAVLTPTQRRLEGEDGQA